MALTAGLFGMTVSFIDNGGNVTSRDYEMAASVATYNDAALAALDILPDIIAVSDAVISSYRVYQVFSETALIYPAAGVQNENTASITVLLTSPGNKKANLNIPAAKQALFVQATGPQANVVDMGDPLVLAFLGNFFTAENFRVSDGEAIDRGLDGKRVHKKNNRG